MGLPMYPDAQGSHAFATSPTTPAFHIMHSRLQGAVRRRVFTPLDSMARALIMLLARPLSVALLSLMSPEGRGLCCVCATRGKETW